jgi:hypothetical protein
LRGILAPGKETHGLGRFLERREGLMGLAFGTVGAHATHDGLTAAGLHPRPVKPLTRDFELPGGTIPVSFNLCFLDPSETPGLMSVVVCEHLTPERLRRLEWLAHPNGARRIRGLTGIAREANSAVGAWKVLFERVQQLPGELRAEFDNGSSLALLDERAFANRFPLLPIPAPSEWPCLVVVSIEVPDLDATAACLARRGVKYKTTKTILVPTEEACGAALEFVNG